MNGTKHTTEDDSPKKVNCEKTQQQQQNSSDEDEPCTRYFYFYFYFKKYAIFRKIINIANSQSSVRTQMQLQVGIKA